MIMYWCVCANLFVFFSVGEMNEQINWKTLFFSTMCRYCDGDMVVYGSCWPICFSAFLFSSTPHIQSDFVPFFDPFFTNVPRIRSSPAFDRDGLIFTRHSNDCLVNVNIRTTKIHVRTFKWTKDAHSVCGFVHRAPMQIFTKTKNWQQTKFF